MKAPVSLFMAATICAAFLPIIAKADTLSNGQKTATQMKPLSVLNASCSNLLCCTVCHGTTRDINCH